MSHLTKLTILTIIGSLMGTGFYFQYSGNQVTEPALAQIEQPPITTQTESREKIYTQADFDGKGRNGEVHRAKNILHVEINPSLSPFTFLINSFTQNSRGQILVFHNSVPEPIQIINLEDPDLFLGDRIHENFNATDINFDGYVDIGILAEGGSRWGAYQYWVFDKKTNTFVENNFTQSFRELNFNQIIFDEAKKQITTNNFCGTLICDKDSYQVTNDRLDLIESHHQEQLYSPDNDGTPIKACTTTITHFQNNAEKITEKTSENFCDGYYWLKTT